MRRCPAPIAAAFSLFLAAAAPGAEPMEGGVPFRLTNDSETTITSPGKAPVTNRTLEVYDYRLARKGDRVELAIDRVTRSTTTNGQEVFHAELSRSGMIRRERAEEKVFDRAGASPEMVAMFDQMEAPIAAFKLDAEGGEVGREVKAQGLLIRAVDVIRSLYPSFPRGRAEWDVKLPFAGLGSVPRGMLHLRKRPAASPDGPVEVDVTGKLDLSGKLGTAEIKRGEYEVKGVQTYDPTLGDWVAGKRTILQDQEVVTAAGDTQEYKIKAVQTLIRLDGPGAKEEKK